MLAALVLLVVRLEAARRAIGWPLPTSAVMNAARQVSMIASIILCASIIIGVLSITGLGVKLTSLIPEGSGGLRRGVLHHSAGHCCGPDFGFLRANRCAACGAYGADGVCRTGRRLSWAAVLAAGLVPSPTMTRRGSAPTVITLRETPRVMIPRTKSRYCFRRPSTRPKRHCLRRDQIGATPALYADP